MNVRRLLAPLLAAVLLAAALPAPAADGGRGWLRVQERGQRDRQFAPPPQRDDWRDPRRDFRRDDGRMPPPQYPQRLSPDERRQLRRDLHDANRDLHPGRRDFRR